jgi:hypothetical protein
VEDISPKVEAEEQAQAKGLGDDSKSDSHRLVQVEAILANPCLAEHGAVKADESAPIPRDRQVQLRAIQGAIGWGCTGIWSGISQESELHGRSFGAENG